MRNYFEREKEKEGVKVEKTQEGGKFICPPTQEFEAEFIRHEHRDDLTNKAIITISIVTVAIVSFRGR